MWDPADIHLSLRRLVGLALGAPPWDVKAERDEIPDDARPAALVEPSAPEVQRFARATVPQGNTVSERSFAVMAYPVVGDTEKGSRVVAQEVERALRGLMLSGLELVDGDPEGPRLLRPSELPVFDFAGVGPDEAGPSARYDTARLLGNWNVQRQQDPVDRARFTVILNCTVRWEWPGAVVPGEPVAASMDPTGEFG